MQMNDSHRRSGAACCWRSSAEQGEREAADRGEKQDDKRSWDGKDKCLRLKSQAGGGT